MSVVYGLLMQGKLHFLAALREGVLSHLKTLVREVSKEDRHHLENVLVREILKV